MAQAAQGTHFVSSFTPGVSEETKCVPIGFVNGTKMRANAGMRESWSEERCKRVLKQTDERIDSILKECDRVDQSESDEGSLGALPEELKEAESLKAKVQKIAAELKDNPKKVYNTTDPDCRHVQGLGSGDALRFFVYSGSIRRNEVRPH